MVHLFPFHQQLSSIDLDPGGGYSTTVLHEIHESGCFFANDIGTNLAENPP